MKKQFYFNLLLLTFIVVTVISAQPQPWNKGDFPPDRKPPREKFEQLEKLKLIEILNLDENTTLKFFARRQESMNKVFKLGQQREEMLEEIEQKFRKGDSENNDKFYKSKIDKILEIENKMLEERKNFIYSLEDILTKEQIMKYVIFDFRLKREIMDMMKDKK